MKRILPVIAAAAAIAVSAAPVTACERHQSHTAMTTVEVVPAPPAPAVIIAPAAQTSPASEIQAEAMTSRPMGAAFENCNRARKNTVYLTQ
jgi:hypothetical protein